MKTQPGQQVGGFWVYGWVTPAMRKSFPRRHLFVACAMQAEAQEVPCMS
jgi:hypothetical protein